MAENKTSLGIRVVTKSVTLKVAFDNITLESGQEIEILKIDEDLDRALIQYPCGKLDWKRNFWIEEISVKKDL